MSANKTFLALSLADKIVFTLFTSKESKLQWIKMLYYRKPVAAKAKAFLCYRLRATIWLMPPQTNGF